MSLNKATRDLDAAQARVKELERWSKQGKRAVVTGLALATTGISLAVTIDSRLGWLALPAAASVVLGVFLWCFVNVFEPWSYSGSSAPRIILARRRLADYQEEYDSAIEAEIRRSS